VLVSLHRAEGYGLPIAEAMSLGKAVVATAWSGNLDFMSDADSALVSCRLVDIVDPQGVYSSGQWAEPDADHAVAALRRLYDDTAWRRAIGEAAARRFRLDAQLATFRASLSAPFMARAAASVPSAARPVAAQEMAT